MVSFCLLSLFVLCSFPVPLSADYQCPSCLVGEYRASDGSCLVVVKNVGPLKPNRFIASKLCEEYGDKYGHEYGAYRLPTVDDPKKHKGVLEWLRGRPDTPNGTFRIWLDLMRDVRYSHNWNTGGFWRWQDQHSRVSGDMWNVMWAAGEPDNARAGTNDTCGWRDENCVYEDINFSANTSFWRDGRCDVYGTWDISAPWLLVCEKRHRKPKKEPLSEAMEVIKEVVNRTDEVVKDLAAFMKNGASQIVHFLTNRTQEVIHSVPTTTEAPRMRINILKSESVPGSAQAANTTPPPAAHSSGAAVTVLVLMYILGICLVSGGGYLVYQGRRNGVQRVGFNASGRPSLNNDRQTNVRL